MEPIRSLVVPVDFSNPSRAAVNHAIALAKLDGAAVHLVHGLKFPLLSSPYDVSMPAAVWEGARRAAEERMETLRKEVEASGLASITTQISESTDPVDVIAQAVELHQPDLVVMGTHGYGGFKHACLGSVAERTIRTLSCPVLAVKNAAPDDPAPAIRRILVPVDFSSHSDQAAQLASGLATRLGASIDLVHSIDFSPESAGYLTPDALDFARKMQTTAAERLEQIVQSIPDEVETVVHLHRGKPASVIEAIAKQVGADLIVMGTHGHTGLSRLFIGSVAERTLRIAPCSVLAVKADEDTPPT